MRHLDAKHFDLDARGVPAPRVGDGGPPPVPPWRSSSVADGHWRSLPPLPGRPAAPNPHASRIWAGRAGPPGLAPPRRCEDEADRSRVPWIGEQPRPVSPVERCASDLCWPETSPPMSRARALQGGENRFLPGIDPPASRWTHSLNGPLRARWPWPLADGEPPPVTADPMSGGWRSRDKGSGRPVGPALEGEFDASGPPAGSWSSGAKGAGKTPEVRPRGLSDATSPPSGGWGSGAKGAGPNRTGRYVKPEDASRQSRAPWGTELLGPRSPERIGPLVPVRSPRRAHVGPHSGRTGSPALVSQRDEWLEDFGPHIVGCHDDVPPREPCAGVKPRAHSSKPMPPSVAVGITEEVYPWTD